jgi:hypothetical protein
MQNQENAAPTICKRVPWNKGKLTGAKPPLRPRHVGAHFSLRLPGDMDSYLAIIPSMATNETTQLRGRGR